MLRHARASANEIRASGVIGVPRFELLPSLEEAHDIQLAPGGTKIRCMILELSRRPQQSARVHGPTRPLPPRVDRRVRITVARRSTYLVRADEAGQARTVWTAPLPGPPGIRIPNRAARPQPNDRQHEKQTSHRANLTARPISVPVGCTRKVASSAAAARALAHVEKAACPVTQVWTEEASRRETHLGAGVDLVVAVVELIGARDLRPAVRNDETHLTKLIRRRYASEIRTVAVRTDRILARQRRRPTWEGCS